MSSPTSSEDPRAGRDRRVVTRRRTFKHGTLDPVIEHNRPLLTWGNAILAILLIGFALYATGNLPQLDAFFVHLDQIGRSHNNTAVSTIIAAAPYLFGGLVLAAICLFIFLFVNSSRRQHSDPKGWHKVADAPPHRRISRRITDLPSMVMPIGKHRPGTKTHTPTPAVAKTPAISVPSPAPAAAVPDAKPATPSTDPIKAAAIAAAARAEAELETATPDLPSFVRPLGKGPVLPPSAPPPPAVDAPQNTAANTAKLEAALAAAKAATAKAEAAIATAKLEAALAAAKSEAAAAEAALAAAKANTAS